MRIRTGYSFKLALGHLEEVMARLKELKYSAAPISDRCSTFGFSKWDKLCKKNGMKPVFGVELGVVESLGEKKPTIDYWTFFAKGRLSDLHELIFLATSNPGREPCLTYDQTMKAKGLIKISGNAPRLDLIQNQADCFVGLSPALPKQVYAEAVAKKLKFLLVPDNVYSNSGDLDLYRVALGRRAFTQSYPQHIASDKEIEESISWFADSKVIKAAIRNKNYALKSCNATLLPATMVVPKKPKTLRSMCLEGAKKLKCDLKRPTYKKRLDRELKLIAEKQFEDYFYVITDLVQFAKHHMVVGPARGSSCGSLVCYLLGITTIDPIPYDLIFERFIDINRTDLPDIDIDFSDEKRHLVFEYAEQKYGAENVARLGTVGMFKPRSALKTVGQNLDIKPWLLEPTLDSIIERSSGDSRALQQLEDTLRDTQAGRELLDQFPALGIAGRLEGHPANASQHAAGIVITEKPVREYVAMDMRTKSLMCDKKDAEELNLLKIDALGLTQLSVFERTIELIGKDPTNGWLESLPTNDKKAFEVLNKAHWSGVFQFNGMALQSLTKTIEVDNIEDIISITALARPGPMATGGAGTWCRRKMGKEPITYPHKLFQPYLKGTLGIVMYQEQVMQIGREIGDLSWEDVTALRKAMSKSLGKEYFDKYGDRWKVAARKKGIPAEVLDKVWYDLCAYGSWAFNRSHSVAYGMVSYWCCWLKAHHPLEFAAATLDSEKDPLRQIELLREMEAEGIKYVPVDHKKSTDRWSVINKGKTRLLLGPLTQIKGIGRATMNEIIDSRKNGTKLRSTLAKKLENAATEIDSLYPVRDALAKLDLSEHNIVSEPIPINKVQCKKFKEVLIIGVVSKIAPKDENEQVNVAKRGYALKGPTNALNLFFKDDTDEIFAKINRYDFERLARDVINRGKAGRAIYAVKGEVPPDFRMIRIKNIRYLGDLK